MHIYGADITGALHTMHGNAWKHCGREWQLRLMISAMTMSTKVLSQCDGVLTILP